jgi:acetylglutamate kinase
MAVPLSPPAVLLRATARARELRGKVLVLKLGGSAMEDPTATHGTLESVVALNRLGLQMVLVHGGGKPIDRAMADAGLTPKKVAGRRYTDDATLDIVVRVLGDINRDLVRQLLEMRCDAFPEIDADYFPLQGEKLLLPGPDGTPIDLGWVGKVTEVDSTPLQVCLQEQDEIPVIPSLAECADSPNGFLNVNADTAASAVAGALKAEAVLFLTDTPGVLRDIKDPASLFPRLTRAECQQLIADGVIAGGMIPKVEACFEALDAGAGRAVILDGRNPYALLAEFVSDEPAGTAIVP